MLGKVFAPDLNTLVGSRENKVGGIEADFIPVNELRVSHFVQMAEIIFRTSDDVGKLIILNQNGRQPHGFVGVGLSEIDVVIDDGPFIPGLLQEVHQLWPQLRIQRVIRPKQNDIVGFHLG